jgi:hypothetical protein
LVKDTITMTGREYDQLCAEPIRLRDEVEKLAEEAANWRRAALEAQATGERLRAVLQQIADGLPFDAAPVLTSSVSTEYRRAAREALDSPKPS